MLETPGVCPATATSSSAFAGDAIVVNGSQVEQEKVTNMKTPDQGADVFRVREGYIQKFRNATDLEVAEFQYFQAARRHDGDQQRQTDEKAWNKMEVRNVSTARALDDWAMWTELG